MASTGPLLNALDLSLGVLERLAQRARVALVRALDRHRHDRPRRQVHGLLGFVGQMGTTILHFGDLRVRIRRTLPFLVRAFLLAPPIQPRQRLPRGRANARRLRQTLQELLVGLSGIPTHDAPHRRVRFQRRRVDRNRLSAQKTRLRQALLDPGEHVTVGFQVDQPPGPRDRRMFRGPLLQPKPQEAPHPKRVRCTPRHPTLGVQALESTPPARAESSVQGPGSDAPEPPHRTGGIAIPRICRSPRTPALYSNANRKDAQGSAADRSSAPTTPLDVSYVCPSPCTNTKTCTCHVRPAQRALSPRTARPCPSPAGRTVAYVAAIVGLVELR